MNVEIQFQTQATFVVCCVVAFLVVVFAAARLRSTTFENKTGTQLSAQQLLPNNGQAK